MVAGFIAAAAAAAGIGFLGRVILRSKSVKFGSTALKGTRKFFEGGFESQMSRREAAMTLGVRETATEEQIKSAHRKLMRINHPDNGGSTYVSTKVNEAKDVLTNKI
ncbi:mitochondrial import inner membrane translocase subunit TIM14 [Acrasis kona]|uniref:Mitochondrial import inner membrane translocase subunit TIM14 n=1 Tax=Acrasis kona TaxID=1008807 RepID=A0AAW2ZKF4_9EUKA